MYMNETLELIARRKSVRSFTGKPVEKKTRDAIIEAARRAPTAGNLMLYSIIEVSDQKLKERLAHTCDNQPFIASAPLVLIFLADPGRLWDLYREGGVEKACRQNGEHFHRPAVSDLMLASCDAMAAAQNAVLAAESLGLGSCYIGDIMEKIEEHRELFSLPPTAFPLTMLVFGYPTERAAERKLTSRYSEWAFNFENRYRVLSRRELEEMTGCEDLNREALRIYRKKTGAEFSAEMRRSAALGMEAFRPDPQP
jgi:nitroreductase